MVANNLKFRLFFFSNKKPIKSLFFHIKLKISDSQLNDSTFSKKLISISQVLETRMLDCLNDFHKYRKMFMDAENKGCELPN